MPPARYALSLPPACETFVTATVCVGAVLSLTIPRAALVKTLPTLSVVNARS